MNIGERYKCSKHDYQLEITIVSAGLVQYVITGGEFYTIGRIQNVPIAEFQKYVASCYWVKEFQSKLTSSALKTDAQEVAVNNHTCSSCGNDRCNKQEKSCWRCGSKLQ